MNPVSIALIGCGAVAQQFYAPALLEIERHGLGRVTALVDPTEQARALVAAQFPSARACREIAESLPLAGLAILASPPAWHRPQAEAAFAAGLDVLSEKPMAGSTQDCAAMNAAAVEAGRFLAIGHYKRFMPAHRAIKALIENQTFGPLREITIAEGGKFTWPAASDSFFRKEQTAGGVLLDIGVHALDLLLWWLGEPDTFTYADDADGGLEANCLLTAEFPRPHGAARVQVRVRLSRDWTTANCSVFHFERATVHCRVNASNQLELTFAGLPMTFAAELRESLSARSTTPTPPLETNAQAFIAQLVDVCTAVRERRAPAVTGSDGLGVIRWIERCYAARQPLAQPWMIASESERGQ